jgi:hypothetical protein
VRDRLRENTEEEFLHLLGKRVECLDSDGKRHVGILSFAGVNDFLHGEFQVTLSRCPIWPVKRESIKEYKVPPSIFKKDEDNSSN